VVLRLGSDTTAGKLGESYVPNAAEKYRQEYDCRCNKVLQVQVTLCENQTGRYHPDQDHSEDGPRENAADAAEETCPAEYRCRGG